jgi:hypothetical protein
MSGSAKSRRRRRRRLPRELRATADLPGELLADAASGGEIQVLEAAADDGAPKLKKITMTAYTGGLMRPSGFGRDVVLDLSGTSVAAGKRPFLLNHNPEKPVGHSEDGGIVVSAQRIRAAGVVSGANDAAREVAESSGNGFPWRSSIGASIERIEWVDDGESVTVNGKRFTGPLYVVRAATVREVSFVTLAGDDRTSAAVMAKSRGKGRTMDFEKWLEARGWKADDLTEKQLETLRASYDAEMKAAGEADPDDEEDGNSKVKKPLKAAAGTPPPPATPPQDDPVGDLRAQGASEVRRQLQIGKLVAAGRLPEEKALELQANAIEHQWSEDKIQLEILKAQRPTTPNIHTLPTDRTPGALVAALCLSAGLPEKVAAKGVSEKEMNEATSQRYRDATLHCLMDQVILQAGGMPYTGNRKSNDFIRASIRADRQICTDRYRNDLQATSGFSTISLTGILGDVAHKAMVAAFEAVETVHQFLTKPVSHSDFKTHHRYRLDGTGSFRKVGSDGELKHGGLTDTEFTARLDTYGMLIALTREMMINDDLGAFMAIPTIIGRLSNTRMEELFFTLLLANTNNFFHATNRNLITGGDSALSIGAVDLAREKFRNQHDKNNKPVLVSPKILLVGTTLETIATNLWANETVNVTTTANKPHFANNPHKGLYRPHVSPYANNTALLDEDGAAIAGQSATKWWMFADPMVRAAFVLATLNGRRLPIIESEETPFDTLGMQWRGYHDFGIGQEEPEAAVQSDGA